MRAYITNHLRARMHTVQWFCCFRLSGSWHLMLRHMPGFIFFSGFVKSSVVCDLTTLSFSDNPLQFERPVVHKKVSVVCTLCACLQPLCNGGRLHRVFMLWWCAPRGGAGKERKQLFVAANRSMSDRNSLGAALRKISLPINWHIVGFLNAVLPGKWNWWRQDRV